MRDVRKVGRRTWLARTSGGLLAIWAGLDFGFGKHGFGVLIGRPSRSVAAAQETMPPELMPDDTMAAEALRVRLGQGGFVSAYVMTRGCEAAIVDTGVAGSAAAIGEAMGAAGLGWDAVRHVVLTHYHQDHAGSIGDVLGLAPGAAVYAGAPDIPRIQAPREITPAAEGDEIFGLQIIETPGHTAGHISVFDPAGAALITGDAVFNIGGNLARTPDQFTADVNQANESVRKMARLAFDRALFMHGEPIESGAQTAFADLASSLP